MIDFKVTGILFTHFFNLFAKITKIYFVSVLGREEGYTVKYIPLRLKEVPRELLKAEGYI